MVRWAAFLALTACAAAPASFAGAALAPAPADNPMVRDIVARLEQAGRAEPDETRRKALYQGAAENLPRALYAGILDAVVPSAPGSLRLEIARAVFLRWAWETPDYAAAWALSSPPGDFRREALAEAAARWAAKNPGDAERWVSALPGADRRWVTENAGRLGADSRVSWAGFAQAEP